MPMSILDINKCQRVQMHIPCLPLYPTRYELHQSLHRLRKILYKCGCGQQALTSMDVVQDGDATIRILTTYVRYMQL